ncbi:NRDE family protein [Rariglobus hedericola]|uniref:NRDE family protein n=1 Tax=Rariglobus hedericola TaxID=2597822 RepID=A0A556QPC0_9BACT|nr:NRDE family protein [Rariglobus hedericola]TSJ78479.1 NRDE family protein [Rariglobus hedericola]
MCTLTWRASAEADGYDLFFNRDERHVRAEERAPVEQRTEDGVRYVAPADGDHGGTWLMLNEHGVTVCLLNYYPRGVVETGLESRGRLPLMCAECVRAEDVVRVMHAVELKRFAPFHLVAVDAAGGSVWLRWDGQAMHEAEAPEFLTSSSFEPERVQAARAARWAAWDERTAEGLAAFQRQYDPAAGAESVLMRRADACTRSVCAVRVRTGVRELDYESMTGGERGVWRL